MATNIDRMAIALLPKKSVCHNESNYWEWTVSRTLFSLNFHRKCFRISILITIWLSKYSILSVPIYIHLPFDLPLTEMECWKSSNTHKTILFAKLPTVRWNSLHIKSTFIRLEKKNWSTMNFIVRFTCAIRLSMSCTKIYARMWCTHEYRVIHVYAVAPLNTAKLSNEIFIYVTFFSTNITKFKCIYI